MVVHPPILFLYHQTCDGTSYIHNASDNRTDQPEEQKFDLHREIRNWGIQAFLITCPSFHVEGFFNLLIVSK
jgi:hypothetical protein